MDTSKVIRGVVNSGRYTVTVPIVKEDYGLKLKIDGVELPSSYQVDFSNNENGGSSVTMIGNSDGVLIPSQFISTGKDVFAFLYHVGVDFGRTVYKFRIPNKLRPDRTNEEPTPEEQSVIDQAISALNTAVAQTAQDVVDAEASAQSASADADRAEQAKEDASTFAQRSANSAQESADYSASAQTSATASANSASASAQIKADVEDLVDDAQGYAQASERSASASANSASQAQGYAQSASASAQSASGYASQADISANTASAKASEASTSAQTASNKASEASQSASQALSYKTDAESAKTASQTAQGLAESARDTAVQAKNDAESARDEAQSLVDGISGKVEQIDSNTERIESLEDDRYKPYVVDSASGSIASFVDGADDLPLKSLVVDINPVQDLHGQDSPYPAGGGKNLLYVPNPETVTINGVTWTCNQDGSITISGTATDASTYRYILFGGGVGVSFDGDYKFVCFASNIPTTTFQGGIRINTWFSVYGDRTTAITGASGQIQEMWFQVKAGQTLNTTIYPMIYKASESTPTAWSPYENICPISGWTEVNVNHSDADTTNPTTITINLGQTVYGAKLYPLEGKALINMAMVDLGTLSNWRYNVGGTGAFDTRVALTPLAKSNTKCICSQYKTLDYPNLGNITNSDFCVGINKKDDGTAYTGAYVVGTLVVKDIRYSDVDAFQTAMNGVMLCYELAEPIEIQLSPNQVNSLLGVNNIWADSGDTTAEYRADTKLYIERLTAPDSADMIADANITSGQYFMVGNSLYKATANIANGSAIVVGTNCTRKSLSEALNEINA